MPNVFAANLRQMRRMMRPAKLSKKSRSILIATAFAPFAGGGTDPRSSAATATGHALGLMSVAAQGLIPGARRRAKATPATVPRLPKGAQFLSRQFRSAQGARRYKLYLPATAPQKPKGLIMMLHGCGQDPDDFAIGTHMNSIAEKHGLAVVYPAQARRDNAGGCWNWFAAAHQTRGAGEPAILAALARKVMRELQISRDHVYVAGLSAGGAMAAILVDIYPDVFAAAGIHSGLARGSASDVGSAMAAMRSGAAGDLAILPRPAKTSPVRRIIFQGDQDSTVDQSNALHLVTAALGTDPAAARVTRNTVRKMGYTRSAYAGAGDAGDLELWVLAGGGHAWSGGRSAGSYTDVKGPDASAQMVRFFLAASR